MAESGYPGLEVSAWFGVFAPAPVPEPVIRRVPAALSAVVATPALAQRLRDLGA